VPIIFVSVLFATFSWATLFAIQPIETQIKESNAIMEGIFLESKTIELENGKLATQMIFKVKREWGLKSDFFDMEEVIIHYPGGKLGNKNIFVEGVPSFTVGERVVILTKNIGNRFWGLNLGLGSFKVITFNNKPILMNSLFPHDKRVSQIELNDFDSKVKLIKNESIKSLRSQFYTQDSKSRFPASEQMGKNRSIASTMDSEENKDDQPSTGVFWLIAFFALIGGCSRLIKARKA
jgi:hypothetical protein